MSEGATQPPSETRYNRACDACRNHKVRCLPDVSLPYSKICVRCARTNRTCTFTAPRKRQERKKTETRVSELEKEVLALQALFDQRKKNTSDGAQEEKVSSVLDATLPDASMTNCDKASGTTAISLSPNWQVSSSFWNSDPRTKEALLDLHDSTVESKPPTTHNPLVPQGRDVIDRGLVSEELATHLFLTFLEDLAPKCPLVVLPPYTTASTMRATKPTLYLAMIAASAGKTNPSLFSRLTTESLSAYTYRTVNLSEKSLELVQAMLIIAAWYCPPHRFVQLKFYEYIHAAATMALDIDLGTSPPAKRRRVGDTPSPEAEQKTEKQLYAELESKRTYLACYILTTKVAIGTRRPLTMRFNGRAAECVECIINSPVALPSDRIFCHWVKHFALAEEICTSFSYDFAGNLADLSETRVQFLLKGFEKRLESWKDEIPPGDHDKVLLQEYYYTYIYTHELAIHDDHPPEDFRPPFHLDHPLPIENDNKLTPAHIDSIIGIIASVHALLDIMIDMEINALRSVPTQTFVRMTYGIIMLTKLYSSSRSGESRIATILENEDLKLPYYFDALITRLADAVGPNECRVPYAFLSLLTRLKEWAVEHNGNNLNPHSVDLANDSFIMVPPATKLAPGSIFSLSENISMRTSAENSHPSRETTNTTTSPSSLLQDLGQYDAGQFIPYTNPDYTSTFSEFRQTEQLAAGFDELGMNMDFSIGPGTLQQDMIMKDWNFNA